MPLGPEEGVPNSVGDSAEGDYLIGSRIEIDIIEIPDRIRIFRLPRNCN